MINSKNQNWKLFAVSMFFEICIVFLYSMYIQNEGYDLNAELWFSYIYGVDNKTRDYMLIAAWMVPYFICRMMPFISLEYEFSGKKYFCMIRYKTRKEYYDRKLLQTIQDEIKTCLLCYLLLALFGVILSHVYGYGEYVDYKMLTTGIILWVSYHVFMAIIEFSIFIYISQVGCLIVIEIIQFGLFFALPSTIGRFIIPICWGMYAYSSMYMIITELIISMLTYLIGMNFYLKKGCEI